ncbi:hypothetical protein ENBRE01_1225 [Enteropsectra breve]|nr:hypothetical protein ENBRE01_1225 [Enteropsectra breve]
METEAKGKELCNSSLYRLFNTPKGNRTINRTLFLIVLVILGIVLGLMSVQIILFCVKLESYKSRALDVGKFFLVHCIRDYTKIAMKVALPLIIAFVLLCSFSKYEEDFWSLLVYQSPGLIKYLVAALVSIPVSIACFILVWEFITKLIQMRVTLIYVVYAIICLFYTELAVKNSASMKFMVFFLLLIFYCCHQHFQFLGLSDDIVLAYTVRSHIEINDVPRVIDRFSLDGETISAMRKCMKMMVDKYNFIISSKNIFTYEYFILCSPEQAFTVHTWKRKAIFIGSELSILRDANRVSEWCGLILQQALLCQSNYHNIILAINIAVVSLLTIFVLFLITYKKDANNLGHGYLQATVVTLLSVSLSSMVQNALQFFYTLHIDKVMAKDDIEMLKSCLMADDVQKFYSYGSTDNFNLEMFNCIFYNLPSYVTRVDRANQLSNSA